MTDLVDAYQHDNIEKYESVLQKNRQEIVADPFIAEHIDEVTRDMRTKAVLKIISPYTRFKTSFVADRLKIPVPEVEEILSFLVADGKTRGHIDIKDGTVSTLTKVDKDRALALASLSSAISSLPASIFASDETFRSVDDASEAVMTLPALSAHQGSDSDPRKPRHKAYFQHVPGKSSGQGSGPLGQGLPLGRGSGFGPK
jgi:COP9 signalosome complex subunit 2